jgi:hypothetical protein
MTPYPLIYCPKGRSRPAVAASPHQVGIMPGHGPDARLDDRGQPLDAGGTCHGGTITPGLRWLKTPAGWWLGLHPQHQPQHLRRVDGHPRVMRWTWIDGAQAGHRWQVPVILTTSPDGDTVLALDRVWRGEAGWQAGDELTSIAERCLAVANLVALADDDRDRDQAIRSLAIDLLTLGHHVDEDLLIATGWLSELTMVRVIQAAIDRKAAA